MDTPRRPCGAPRETSTLRGLSRRRLRSRRRSTEPPAHGRTPSHPRPRSAMRVLMLGWDFSPRLSGGVGSACQGLAQALSRSGEPTEVLFVLPRLRGDEEPEKVRLVTGAEERPAAALPSPAPALPAPVAAAAPEPAPIVQREEPPPALPAAAEA